MDERIKTFVKNTMDNKNYPDKHLVDEEGLFVTLSTNNSYENSLCTIKINRNTDRFSITYYTDDFEVYEITANFYGEECTWKHEFRLEDTIFNNVKNILKEMIESAIVDFFDNYDPTFEYAYVKKYMESCIESAEYRIEESEKDIESLKNTLEAHRTNSMPIIWEKT